MKQQISTATILFFNLILLVASSEPLKLEQLDNFLLSRIRFEFKNLPKSDQCDQFVKSVEMRLKGQESQSKSSPSFNQVDLLTRLSDLLKSRFRGQGANFLIRFFEECVQIIDNQQRDGSFKQDQSEDLIPTPVQENKEDSAENIVLVESLKRNKELENEVEDLKHQRNNKIEHLKELSNKIGALSNELGKKNIDLENLSHLEGDIELLKQKLQQVSAENENYKQHGGNNETLAKITAENIFLKEQIASQNQSYSSKIELYKEHLEALESNELRLEKELERERDVHHNLGLTCKESSDLASNCESSLANCRESFSAAKDELRRALERVGSRNQECNSSLAEKDIKISELAALIDELNKKAQVDSTKEQAKRTTIPIVNSSSKPRPTEQDKRRERWDSNRGDEGILFPPLNHMLINEMDKLLGVKKDQRPPFFFPGR